MLYFKNRELAETYHVSDRTIRNWIEETKQGKLQLSLHEQGGRSFVANTTKNLSIIEELVSARKKFRPHHTFKVITPKPEFYKFYNPAQIYDILTNIEIHHEIPRQYNYFDGGAHAWDAYVKRLASEETSNIFNRGVELLNDSYYYIDNAIGERKRVNIIDLGGGNAMPARSLIAHLIKQGVMGRYVDLDISKEMLAIARKNIDKWFGDTVAFEGYETDINYDRFANILAEEYLGPNSEDTINIVLFLGMMLANLRTPDGALRVIHDSLGLNDLLVYTNKLDTPTTRRFFDFNVREDEPVLPPIHRLVIDLLNIDKSMYDLDLGYDSARKERYERIRFNTAVTIQFDFAEGSRSLDLNKGDSILVWRARQQGALDVIHQFDRNDFYMLHSSQTDDQEYILTVSRVKSE
ncbi:MAG TPA: L-histidine N(alpha)-methyltransferase [Candidatus Saccharimonadales bacterium]